MRSTFPTTRSFPLWSGILFWGLVFILSDRAKAETTTVAVASGMKFAMDEIATSFQRAFPKNSVSLVYGSSVKLQTQIQNGAPFDLFFSADTTSPLALSKSGLAGSDVVIYSIGHLVIWSSTVDVSHLKVEDLADPKFSRIAIGNPRVAPYGKRAEESLRTAKVWEKVESRLVLGESITQTAQFIASGNATVGLIALSLALSPELTRKGHFSRVPDDLHLPIEQGFIITKRGMGVPAALQFAAFMSTEEARSILLRFGYSFPGSDRFSKRR